MIRKDNSWILKGTISCFLMIIFMLAIALVIAIFIDIDNLFIDTEDTDIDICYGLTVDDFEYVCVANGEPEHVNNQTFYTVKCHYECDTRYYEYIYGYREVYDCHISFAFDDTFEMTVCNSNQSYGDAADYCISRLPEELENITVIRK